MLCYRDMAFCSSTDCNNKQCQRQLTDKVKQEADELGLPIATSEFSINCKDYLTDEALKEWQDSQ